MVMESSTNLKDKKPKDSVLQQKPLDKKQKDKKLLDKKRLDKKRQELPQKTNQDKRPQALVLSYRLIGSS